MVDTEIRLIIFFAAEDGSALYSQQKQDRELTVTHHELLIAKFTLKLRKVGKTRQFSSVQLLSCVQLIVTPWTAAHQVSLSPTPKACSYSCPLSWWRHPTISSSVIPFPSYLQSYPASGFFPTSKFFTSGGQSIVASASASVLPMNIQDWFPLGLTSLISLQSKGPSTVFPNTTVQKHQLFNAQLSL